MTPDEIQQFHAARKEAGLKIDPQTAEINVGYGQILDPYGLEENLPPEAQCIGRLYFARFPGLTNGLNLAICRKRRAMHWWTSIATNGHSLGGFRPDSRKR